MNDAEKRGVVSYRISHTLLEKYNVLVSEVENHLSRLNMKRFEWLPDLSNWSKKKKNIFTFLVPYHLLDTSLDQKINALNSTDSVILLSWVSCIAFWYFIGNTFLNISLKIAPIPSNEITPNILAEIFAWFGIVLYLAFGLFSYIHTIWLFLNKKTSWQSRFFYFISILLTGCTIYYELALTRHLRLNFVFSDWRYNSLLRFDIIVFGIPFILFLATLFLVLGIFFFYGIGNSLSYFNKIFSANDSIYVERLMYKIMQRQEYDWNLISLPISEIKAIKELARNRIDNTEKKTLPITILIASLTLVVTFSPLSNKLTNIYHSIADYYRTLLTPPLTLLSGIVMVTLLSLLMQAVLLTTLVILIIIGKYIRLLGNFFVQSIIIEACTVAEHTRVELDKEIAKQKRPRSRWYTLLDCFFGRQ